MATLLNQPPRYYSHLILAQTKAQSVIFLFEEPLLLILPPGINSKGIKLSNKKGRKKSWWILKLNPACMFLTP